MVSAKIKRVSFCWSSLIVFRCVCMCEFLAHSISTIIWLLESILLDTIILTIQFRKLYLRVCCGSLSSRHRLLFPQPDFRYPSQTRAHTHTHAPFVISVSLWRMNSNNKARCQANFNLSGRYERTNFGSVLVFLVIIYDSSL